MTRHNTHWQFAVALLLLVASAAAGCAGGSDEGGANPAGDMSAPVYAMVTHVWSDEGPTGYVALMNSLDASDVSLETAREFPGYTSVGVASGQLLVNPSTEDLTIERYRITDDLEWYGEGTLSFANEPGVAVLQHVRRSAHGTHGA